MEKQFAGFSFNFRLDELNDHELRLLDKLSDDELDNWFEYMLQYISTDFNNMFYKFESDIVINYDIKYSIRYQVYTIYINRIFLV